MVAFVVDGSFENYFNVVGKLVSQKVEVKYRSDGNLDRENLIETVNWMEGLLSGLYCVNWLVSKRVVNVDDLFASEAK